MFRLVGITEWFCEDVTKMAEKAEKKVEKRLKTIKIGLFRPKMT